MALMHDILGLSMAAPKILDQLDLWDKVRDWIPSREVATGAEDKASSAEDWKVAEQTGMDVDEEPGGPVCAQQHAFGVTFLQIHYRGLYSTVLFCS